MERPSTTTKSFIDPVCGMKVASSSTCLATYKRERYYFCADACRKAFEANPQKYIETKHKSWWKRYLERVKKATEGKPPKCH